MSELLNSPSSSPSSSPSKRSERDIELDEVQQALREIELNNADKDLEFMFNIKKLRDNVYWIVKNQMTKEEILLFESDMGIFKDGKATALDEEGRQNLKKGDRVFGMNGNKRSKFKYILVEKYDQGVHECIAEYLEELENLPEVNQEYIRLREREEVLIGIIDELGESLVDLRF